MQPGYAQAREIRQPMQQGMGIQAGQVQYPVMAPGQVGMPSPFYPAANGLDQLATMNGLQVQERANLIQELTAMLGEEIEMANKYRVLDNAGNQMFYAVERTDCCKRQMQNMCCHDCASWNVDILYTPPGALNQQFIQVVRSCQCTCCCFNRPTADVMDQVTGQKLGSFRDPCTCFGLRFQVRDANDVDILEVDGGCCCCQPGMWCPLPCGPCSEVTFDVKDVHSRSTVAKVSKRVPGILSWCFTPDVDNYQVEFQQVAHPQWKAILLAFTIFMDFRYFNTNRNQDNAREAAQS